MRGGRGERALYLFVKSRKWCGTVNVIERDKNLGLANSIIRGVTDLCERYGRVIVLEDDLVLHPQFLAYMNESLEKYKDSPRVFSVTGFNYPVKMLRMPRHYRYTTYFSYRCHSWGWATWKDRYEKVDFEIRDLDVFLKDKKAQKLFNRGGDNLTDMLKLQMAGKIDSWAIRFCYAQFRNDAYCLYPVRSLVHNIGFDTDATHTKADNKLSEKLTDGTLEFIYPDKIEVDPIIGDKFKKMFHPCLRHRVKSLLSRLVNPGTC
jgi:hypothetical protein